MDHVRPEKNTEWPAGPQEMEARIYYNITVPYSLGQPANVQEQREHLAFLSSHWQKMAILLLLLLFYYY